MLLKWKSCSSNAAAGNLGIMTQKFDVGDSRSPNFPRNISLSSNSVTTPIPFSNSLDSQTGGSGVGSNYYRCLKAQDQARHQAYHEAEALENWSPSFGEPRRVSNGVHRSHPRRPYQENYQSQRQFRLHDGNTHFTSACDNLCDNEQHNTMDPRCTAVLFKDRRFDTPMSAICSF